MGFFPTIRAAAVLGLAAAAAASAAAQGESVSYGVAAQGGPEATASFALPDGFPAGRSFLLLGRLERPWRGPGARFCGPNTYAVSAPSEAPSRGLPSVFEGGRARPAETWGDVKDAVRVGLFNLDGEPGPMPQLMGFLRSPPRGADPLLLLHFGDGQWVLYRIEGSDFESRTLASGGCATRATWLRVQRLGHADGPSAPPPPVGVPGADLEVRGPSGSFSHEAPDGGGPGVLPPGAARPVLAVFNWE